MIKGVLTFFCGKMGAGKSTKAKEIVAKSQAVLISEDELLAALYPNLIHSISDYIDYSKLLKPPVKNLVQSVLLSGSDVILDFPANTVLQRRWLVNISNDVGALHNLIYLETSHKICLQQIQKRRSEEPNRNNTDTPEMFNQVSKFFQPPTPDEKLNQTLFTRE